MKYHIHTLGCQMNIADSLRLASGLEKLGATSTDNIAEADIAVLNTCVVRQSAEDRAYGWLNRVGALKRDARPDLTVGLMGCLVGVKGNKKITNTFPDIDVFLPPSDPEPLLNLVEQQQHIQKSETDVVSRRHALQDGELILPAADCGTTFISYVPVVYGCSHACTFCIIPFRRGVERSRPVDQIVAECRSLAGQGVKEITLLGQIVDRYGYDLPGHYNLAMLLERVHETPGLERIRFLTSHPNYLDDDLLRTVAEMPKICDHIEVPVQSGSNEVLENMRRGYTVEQYNDLIERIRMFMPNGSISCDVIVGFPGESESQFQATCDLLLQHKFDKVHIAKYSPRPGTVSARRMEDDVPAKEKERRRKILDEIQASVLSDINRQLLGKKVEILVEGYQRDRWRGRTRTNKLVFFEDDREWAGNLVDVEINWAGPWFMVGKLVRTD